jgi:hypothetical protein
VTGQLAGEGGDEGAGQGGAGQQLEDEVGQAKGDPVGPQLGAGAKAVGDGDAAHDAQETAAQETRRHDNGSASEAGPGGLSSIALQVSRQRRFEGRPIIARKRRLAVGSGRLGRFS